MWQCPNCGRTIELAKEDYDIITDIGLISIECFCDKRYGLNIVVGVNQCEPDVREIFSFDASDQERTVGTRVIKKYILTEKDKKAPKYSLGEMLQQRQ